MQSGAFTNLPPGEVTILTKDEVGNIGTSEPGTILSGVSFAATIQPIHSATTPIWVTTTGKGARCLDGKN